MQTIMKDIIAELKSAEIKHPKWPADPMYMDQIVNEEKGEVTRAVVQHVMEGKSINEVKNELIQTAAMCIRMLKNIGVYQDHHVSPEKVEVYPIIRWDVRTILDAYKNKYNVLINDGAGRAQLSAIPEQEFADVVNTIMEKATEFINANYIQL